MIAKKYKLPIQNFVGKKPVATKSSQFFVLKLFRLESDRGGRLENNHSRFGLVISGSVINKATARNKIKRAVFDWLRLNKDKLPTYDYLFILKNTAKDQKIEAVLNDLVQLSWLLVNNHS